MSSSTGSGLFVALCVPLIGLMGIGLGSDCKRRKERLTAATCACVLFAGLVLQAACGGSNNTVTTKPGTPPGKYTIAVTGTDSTGVLVHNTQVTLTVQ